MRVIFIGEVYNAQSPVDPGYGVPGWPSHPIAPGGPPPRPWGPINYPDQGLPGNQPYPDQSLPGQQPGIWGGGGVGNYPDAGFPGPQPGGPVRPWGPINYPDQGLPGQQPRPWGPINYPDQGLPLPPDYQNPPEGGKPPPPQGGWGYSPEYGWGYFPPENIAKPKQGQKSSEQQGQQHGQQHGQPPKK